MIPDHLIDKALDAWIGDHNCPHPDLIRAYRVLVTRSLEAVAAEIWESGYNEGRTAELLRELGVIADSEQLPNPYRTTETE